jgi:hypothetical protein
VVVFNREDGKTRRRSFLPMRKPGNQEQKISFPAFLIQPPAFHEEDDRTISAASKAE